VCWGVQVSFRVIYHVSCTTYLRGFVTACCLMALFAMALSVYRLISWRLRANRAVVDVVLIGKFIFVYAGHVGSVLFAVLYVSSVYWSWLYKVIASDR